MILNKTQSSSQRYRIQPGSMGCAGEPENHVTSNFVIVNGVDKGNGYQGYMSVEYFLDPITCPHITDEARNNCKKFLESNGYDLNTLLR